MILQEIVLEGVKCFREKRNIPLKPGFDLVYGPNESGKTTLLETIYILLDPLRNVGEEEEYPSWGPPGPSRAGIVIQEGQDSYRITKDFVNGQVSLSRRNPQTQKYESVATDPARIDTFLRQNIGIPPISTFRRLFCFDRKDLPSGRQKVVAQRVQTQAPSPAPGAGVQPSFAAPQVAVTPPAGYGLTVEEKKRRLDELRSQRDKAKAVADIQFEIDGLESKLFDIENKIKGIRSEEDHRDQLQNQLKKLSSFQELPRDIIHRIEDFEGTQREQHKMVNVMDQQIGEAQTAYMQIHSRTPFHKEQNFLIAAGCVAAGIITRFIGLQEKFGFVNFIQLLLIVAGLGLVIWIVFNEMNARTTETEAEEKLEKLKDELKEIEKKFEVESSVIKRMMVDAGVEDPKELHDKLKEYRDLMTKVEEFDERIEKSKRAAGYSQLERERKQYSERIEELNNQMRQAGGAGFVQDPADIQREIDSLQYSLDHPGAAPPPTAAAPAFAPAPPMPMGGGGMPPLGNPIGGDDFLGGGDFIAGLSAPTPGPPMPADSTMISDKPLAAAEGAENPVDSLWATAEAFSGLDRSTLIMQIKDQFNARVAAFTNKTYGEGDLSSEKTVSLRTTTGSYTDLEKLSPSSQDAAWLALKLSLIENILKKKVMPVVMDDPLRYLDDARLANVSKALKKLGSLGQVVLVSTQRAHSKIADLAVSLAPTPEKT